MGRIQVSLHLVHSFIIVWQVAYRRLQVSDVLDDFYTEVQSWNRTKQLPNGPIPGSDSRSGESTCQATYNIMHKSQQEQLQK